MSPPLLGKRQSTDQQVPLSSFPLRVAHPRPVNPPPTPLVDLTGREVVTPPPGKRPKISEPPPLFSSPVVISRRRPDLRGELTWQQAGCLAPPTVKHFGQKEFEALSVKEDPPSPLLESDEPESPKTLQRLDAFHEEPHPLLTSHDEDLEYEEDEEMEAYYCEACFCVPCLCYDQDETSVDPYE